MMNNINPSLGFYIPNSDYLFQANTVIVRKNYCFVITNEKEIIVFEKTNVNNENYLELNKKFILFSNPQIREKIIDIFLVRLKLGLLCKSDKTLIVTISENLILNFWNIKDGLCINKVNLSKYAKREDNLQKVYSINERFIVFLCM